MMKIRRTVSVLAIFGLAFTLCLAQEKPRATLFDQFDAVSNDGLQTRVKNFQIQLKEDDSRGLIILHAAKNNPLSNYLNERRIIGCLGWQRRFFGWEGDPERKFAIAFGESRPKTEIFFWKVPVGAELPEFDELKKDFDLAGMTRPQLIYQESIPGEYCPINFDLDFYAEFLRANQNLNGKIVIYERTRGKYKAVRKDYLQKLTEIHRISPNQIKIVRGKPGEESDAEFWLLPDK